LFVSNLIWRSPSFFFLFRVPVVPLAPPPSVHAERKQIESFSTPRPEPEPSFSGLTWMDGKTRSEAALLPFLAPRLKAPRPTPLRRTPQPWWSQCLWATFTRNLGLPVAYLFLSARAPARTSFPHPAPLLTNDPHLAYP